MDKELVNDEICEQMVIGVLLVYPDTFAIAADILREDVFYSNDYKTIFKAITRLHDAGENIDMISVSEYLKKDGSTIDITLLMDITSCVDTSLNFQKHCLRLNELWQRRKFWMIGQRLINAGTSEIEDIDELKTYAVDAIKSLDEIGNGSIKGVKDAAKELSVIIDNNRMGRQRNGIETGFEYIDMRGGLQGSDLMVIAAETSQGKTSLALDFAVNAASKGHPVAFYSTEMMGTQLTARMLAPCSGISSRVILQDILDDRQMESVKSAIRFAEKLPIFYDDTSTLTLERIIASIRKMERKRHIKVAFVDYLQVLQTNEKSLNKTEEQFFGMAARKLKNLAKELGICIVLMSQLSRDRVSVEPTLARLRGSGQIVEAADVVLLIYRPEAYKKQYTGKFARVNTSGTALIKVAKGRNIGTGEFICGFRADTTHFYPLEDAPMVNDIEDERPF